MLEHVSLSVDNAKLFKQESLYIQHISLRTVSQFNHSHLQLLNIINQLTGCLTAERETINYLFAFMDSESFKFNKLEALVIPQSRYILTGEEFKAKVLLAAMDTTQRPEIIVNGRKIGYDGDFGVYKETATKVGIHKLKGVINYITPSGVTLPRAFEMDYEVANPAVVISPTKMPLRQSTDTKSAS